MVYNYIISENIKLCYTAFSIMGKGPFFKENNTQNLEYT